MWQSQVMFSVAVSLNSSAILHLNSIHLREQNTKCYLLIINATQHFSKFFTCKLAVSIQEWGCSRLSHSFQNLSATDSGITV